MKRGSQNVHINKATYFFFFNITLILFKEVNSYDMEQLFF